MDVIPKINEHIKQFIAGSSQLPIQKSSGMFKIMSAIDWSLNASNRPNQKAIFGPLWFEDEICILFADTGLGKSILAVQICESIATGVQIKGLSIEIVAQIVLYLDFELSDKQFQARYSNNNSDLYSFSSNFLRAEIDSDKVDFDRKQFKTAEDYISDSLEQAVIYSGAKIVVVDNLTYLRDETEKAKDALPLMKHLKALKSKYGLSILALAHTPKRDSSIPITRNDLSGSKMLINFCDSAFSIGESAKDSQLRYIKQIKARNTEIRHGADNVLIFQVHKPSNYLHFDFLGFDTEKAHLKIATQMDQESMEHEMTLLRKQGKSLREIADALGVSHMKVQRFLNPKPAA